MSKQPITMYRQGDLLFLLTTNIPPNVTKSESNIILKSSAISNSHILENGTYYRIIQDENSRWNRSLIIGFIDADKGITKVKHDEHQTLDLPDGFYEVRRQREALGFVID